MIHLVCGPIGAGKTTYAIKLAKEQRAVRFSEDDWLAKLFVPEAPKDLLEQSMQVVGAWATERYQRCRSQIWLICQELLEIDSSIVLDGAAANKEQRDMIREKARQYNVGFQLHYITAPAEKRRERVFERNRQRGITFSLEVTPAMFEHTEQYFEAPKGKELEQAIVIQS
jgi:predicted kinase